MERLIRDVRLAARVLLKRPLITVLAALSLALGIGANTAIFSIVNALFLKSMAVADADRVMAIYTSDKKNPGLNPMSHLNWKDVREQNDVFSEVFAYDWVPLSVSSGGEAGLVFGQLVSGNYFGGLGVTAALGRVITPEEDRAPGAHPVAVLSHSYWQRRLGGDASVIGQKLTINATPFTVIGVTPANFTGVSVGVQPDLWAPMAMNRELRKGINWYETRRGLFVQAFGRLKPGVGRETAQAALTTIADRLEKEFPQDNEGRSLQIRPFAESTLFPGIRGAAMAGTGMLMVVVALVLLIACANVANLLLARATARRREISVRLALGASRGDLLRQLLTESILLALAGAALGLLVARWAQGAILGFFPSLPFPVTLSLNLDLDPKVLAFTLVVALVTGIVSGLAPALQLARPQLVESLKERGPAEMRGNRRFAARNLLVGAQVALSLVALIGAGLFVRSLAAAQRSDPGFDTAHLGIVSFDIGLQGYDEDRGRLFLEQIIEQVGAVPGVKSLSIATSAPLSFGLARSVFPEGQDSERGILVAVNSVSRGYFETLGIPVTRGRALAATDRKGAPLVAVVNETAAAKFWPDKDPIGQRFRFFGDEQSTEIVGVARNAKYGSLGEEPQPYIYTPLDQTYNGAVTLIARAQDDPNAILLPVQRELSSLQREMPLVGIATIGQVLHNSLWAPRLGASLLAIFGLLALVLASVGIYGVMSYAVSQRSQELGIRMALGAKRSSVLGLVMRQGMFVVGFGLAIGLLVAFALTRLVATLLFISPTDPLVFAGTCVLLAAVGALANLFPALRATTVDPLTALRYE